MNNPEEAIERVLTGLREAEAPVGMEARILAAVDARAAMSDSREQRRSWIAVRTMLGPGQGFRLAGAGVLAGVVVLAALLASMRKTSSVASDRPGVRVTVASCGLASAKEAVPQRLKLLESEGGYGTAKAVPLSKTASRSIEAEAHLDYDSLAVSEMLAPSRPAPPLPLTHQEELLAEVVRKGDPEQVADLKPEVRAQQVEIAKAEFHDFFEPPPAKESE